MKGSYPGIRSVLLADLSTARRLGAPSSGPASPASEYARRVRREREQRAAYVIACVLYHQLGWPIVRGEDRE